MRYASLTIPEIFELVDNTPIENQPEVLDHYFNQNGHFKKFMSLYFVSRPEWIGELTYRQRNNIVSNILSSQIKELNNIFTDKSLPRKKQLEQLFEMCSSEEMMFLENWIQHSLEKYYPNIDWTYFNAYK